MKIKIPFGKDGFQTVTLDDSRAVKVLEANEVPTKHETDTISKAIANPLNSVGLDQFLQGARSVLVVINDATRPTPTEKILDCIIKKLRKTRFRIIVATGAHRAPSDEEYCQILGNHYHSLKDATFAHDAKDNAANQLIGNSSHGTPIHINKAALAADRIIVTGSVEPHYFAGYTGGRKAILPGIAGISTIEANHKLAMDNGAKSLALSGNPVHQDMTDAIIKVKKKIFSIMTVLDKNHKVYEASAGHIHDSFIHATTAANNVFAAPLKEKVDIAVSVVKYPQDVDLYQAQKGLDNAKLALKDKGILILVAQCRNGVGSPSFAKLLRSCDKSSQVIEAIKKKYVLGYHKAGKMAEIDLWAEMWAVTGLKPELLSGLFIRPFSCLQQAVNMALTAKGDEADILFLMDGGLTVPQLS